jgi:hypothetical protein
MTEETLWQVEATLDTGVVLQGAFSNDEASELLTRKGDEVSCIVTITQEGLETPPDLPTVVGVAVFVPRAASIDEAIRVASSSFSALATQLPCETLKVEVDEP